MMLVLVLVLVHARGKVSQARSAGLIIIPNVIM